MSAPRQISTATVDPCALWTHSSHFITRRAEAGYEFFLAGAKESGRDGKAVAPTRDVLTLTSRRARLRRLRGLRQSRLPSGPP